jgi:hypothetical protein
MADFINTAELMPGNTPEEREENLFKKFITHDPSLTELKDDRIKILRPYALYHNDLITQCDFPNLIQVGESTFQYSVIETCNLNNITYIPSYCFNNSNLHEVSFNKDKLTQIGYNAFAQTNLYSFTTNNTAVSSTSIEDYAFYRTYNLTHFFMPNLQMNILTEPRVFDNSRIARRGYFYVPNNLINSYKEATNWSLYADRFRDIAQGIQNDDIIQDSWAEITALAAPSARYHIGDTKTILVDGYLPIVMKIVGFDKDILTNNQNSRAKITWMTADLITLRTEHTVAQIKQYLDSITDKINAETGNKIQAVEKYTYEGMMSGSSELLWLPSTREMNLRIQETDGPIYDDSFTSLTARRFPNSTGEYGISWPLRTKLSLDGDNCYFNDMDDQLYTGPNYFGIVFGFCT